MKRNLLFHCYPIRWAGWEWHVKQLLRYRDAWNGRRIVSLVTDGTTEPEDSLRRIFAPLNAELLFSWNQSGLGEVATFIPMLSRLESRDPNEATFYAHAKGVTHFREPPEKQAIYQKWSEAMYVLALSRPDAVDRLLARYEALGSFRLDLKRSGNWVYSGTFFWLRHDALFSRNWKQILEEKHGVEDYPGRHVAWENAYCFTEDQIPWQDLYSGFVTDDRIRAWKEKLDCA